MPAAFKRAFLSLTLRVEGFTYFIPVPVAIFIYHASLLNYLNNTGDLHKALISALFAATWTFCVGTYWRYRKDQACWSALSGKSPNRGKIFSARTATLGICYHGAPVVFGHYLCKHRLICDD